MRASLGRILVGCLLLVPASAFGQATAGLALFEQYCGSCHNTPATGSRAPDRVSLSQRTPEAILDTITTGSMAVNASALTPAQNVCSPNS
jgi:mono/diheme cytochrome c family protein